MEELRLLYSGCLLNLLICSREVLVCDKRSY